MIKCWFDKIKKLNTKLLICTITPMLIILLLAASTSIRAITNTITQLSLQQLRTEAASSCDYLGSFLNKYLITLSSESSSYTLERYMRTLTFGNNPKTNPYYYQLIDTLDNIYLSDSENINMVWIADFDSSIGIGNTTSQWSRNGAEWNLSKQSWYQQAVSKKTAFTSDPFLSLYNEAPVAAVIVPIQDSINDRVLGVLALELDLNSIQNVVESVTSTSNSQIMVLDSEKHIVSHPKKHLLLQPAPQATGPVIRLGEETNNNYGLFQFNKDNKSYLAYASAIQDSSWIMVAFIEKSFISRQIFPLILQIMAIFILSVLLFTIIVSAFSKMITQPLEEVTTATKEIAKGNYTLHLTSSSKDEVGQLAEAADITIQTLRRRAMFDSLTGIYNEFAFSSRTKQLIADNPEQQYALIRFDLVRFKMVNDIFGTKKGDELLNFIASILIEEVSLEDSYGRLNNDVFCICTSHSSKKELLDLIYRITSCVEAFPINFNLTPYFGICLVNPEVSLNTLLDWSSLALRTIKGSTLTNYAFYNNEMREQLLTESKIENEMADALEQGQFLVYLQPKCNIATSEIVGAESLVRWIHPVKGIIPPDLFIPLFERNGFIIKLDEYIWEETCKLLRSWLDKGYSLIPVSVNISRVHIFDPEFCSKITNLVHKYQIPIQMLELEFTESAFISDLDELYKVMQVLRKRGFTLSMDDFGSGYSSLNMLKNSPVDVIKIDREFLNESTGSDNGRIIIRSTIAMLRQLNMQIVAEGVETSDQADFLLDSGCSIAQGYYYSKPVDISSFEEFAKLKQK